MSGSNSRRRRWPGGATARALGVALVAAGTFVSTMAHAADAGSDEAAVEARRTEAKTKYQAGVEAYDRKRYKDAVDLFLAADRLAPSAPLSFNIARAYERLGDGSSALRWYRDYLRRNPSAENAPQVRDVVKKLATELSAKGVQQLSVLSTPVGATVSIDAQPVGVTPWTGELPPGKHHLMLSFRGYADTERDVELPSAEPLDVAVHLEPAAATPVAQAPPPAAPAAPTAVALPPAAPPSSRKSLGPWPWITLGAGAAVLGGSLTFELLRRSAESDAKGESTQLGYQSALDTMESRKTTARVLLGVGGAIALAGGVLLIVDSAGSSSTAVGLGCAPGGCALQAGGRF